MFKGFTTPVRRFLNSFGYEIVKLQDALTTVKVGNWLHKLDIETIVDVGSNEGQFISIITRTLPNKKIYAFEPIKSCFQSLLENTKQFNVKAYNYGLSDVNGSTEINVSNNLYSSSILDMKDLHKDLYPDSEYTQKETIELRRLDDVIEQEAVVNNILIKIDVQGYEEKVLAGAPNTIRKAAVVIIETSFEPLYAGQWLFNDVYQYFAGLNFRLVGFADQTLSKKTGIPLYGDAIFVNSKFVDKVF
jgi:FkbM family methyltransferase